MWKPDTRQKLVLAVTVGLMVISRMDLRAGQDVRTLFWLIVGAFLIWALERRKRSR